MITDDRTNYLYLADSLKKEEYSNFLEYFTNELDAHNIPFNFLEGTKDIWAVDYMPVQINDNEFVQFVYNPDYLRKKSELRDTITDVDSVCRNFEINRKKSAILLDGGNIIRSENRVIISNKVFKENPNIPEHILNRILEETLEVEDIVFIPWEKNDFTGHADGIVRFLDEYTVIINKYTIEKNFKDELIKVLKNSKLDYIEIPYNPYQNKNNDEAYGVYINYLQMKDVIFLPIYGGKLSHSDDDAIEFMQRLFPIVIPIESNAIAKKGGVLNCITWNVKLREEWKVL